MADKKHAEESRMTRFAERDCYDAISEMAARSSKPTPGTRNTQPTTLYGLGSFVFADNLRPQGVNPVLCSWLFDANLPTSSTSNAPTMVSAREIKSSVNPP